MKRATVGLTRGEGKVRCVSVGNAEDTITQVHILHPQKLFQPQTPDLLVAIPCHLE